jgi:hypothetical protein
MRKFYLQYKLYLIAIIAINCFIGRSYAESNISKSDAQFILSYQIFYPDINFKNIGYNQDIKFKGFASFINARINIKKHILGCFDLPYSTGKVKSTTEDISNHSFTIGNPYLGIRVTSMATTGVFFEFGVRPSTRLDERWEALTAGFNSDISRCEAFTTSATLIQTGVGVIASGLDGAFMEAAVRPSGYFYREKGGEFGETNEQALHLDIIIGYRSPKYMIKGGISALDIYAKDSPYYCRFNGEFSFDFSGVKPGLSLQLPWGENINEVLTAVIGLKIEYGI